MCHRIKSKTWSRSSTLKVNTDVHEVHKHLFSTLLLFVWRLYDSQQNSSEVNTGSTTVHFYSSILLSQILKIVNIRNLFLCTMCITIELWSSIEKLSEGILLFCVIFLLLFWLQLHCKASEQIHLPPAGACCVLTCLLAGRMKAPCLNWREYKYTRIWLNEE